MNCKLIFFLALGFTLLLNSCNLNLPENYRETKHQAEIYPDYVDVTIPVNIAPLNFSIEEEGDEYIVQLSGEQNQVTVHSKSSIIQFDQKKWKKLIYNSKGKSITAQIFILKDKEWHKYDPFNFFVSEDKIDSYLTYRLINSGYILWNKMGLYERNLETFSESPIVVNTSINDGCVNCHTASRTNPEKALFHVRAKHSGTILIDGNNIEKLDTKTDYTMSSAVYPAWHPNGRHIAFSINKIHQMFYSVQGKSIEVSDKYSDLIVYDTETKRITTSPKLSTEQRENLPEWSADGKSIYYISAPPANDLEDRIRAKYSLVKIPYNIEENQWGEVDTLISGPEINHSISFPKCSPDGKLMAFNMTDYGYFTIHHKTSELYLMDLETNKYWNAKNINSSETESYHSWSSNSRWLIFSSRRIDGVHTRTFIANIDDKGRCAKPFVLPQRNPNFYKDYLLNYNRPELMVEKTPVSSKRIRNKVYRNAKKTDFDPSVEVNALSGATKLVLNE